MFKLFLVFSSLILVSNSSFAYRIKQCGSGGGYCAWCDGRKMVGTPNAVGETVQNCVDAARKQCPGEVFDIGNLAGPGVGGPNPVANPTKR